MLREFCSPIFVLENMTKSSVYKIEFDFVHFGRTKGSENGMSLMNRLDSNGLRIQPWCTPLACLILANFYGTCRVRIQALYYEIEKTATDINLY